MKKSHTTIGIVDDHNLFRIGLKRLINSFPNFMVTMQASNGFEMLEKIEAGNQPELLLLDINMPKMSGLEALEVLTHQFPLIKVLMISMHDDVPFIVQAMKNGAKGYILKEADSDELQQALTKVNEVGYYLNEKLSRILVEGMTKGNTHKPKTDLPSFTEIELDILKLICQGFTSQEIADKIYRSRRTIEGHKQRLLDKTDTKNSPALVAWAFRKGIMD